MFVNVCVIELESSRAASVVEEVVEEMGLNAE